MTLRAAVFTAALFASAVARAATSVPSGTEKAYENSTPSSPVLDYHDCPTPQAQASSQLDAVLRHPGYTERGEAIAKGGCNVEKPEQAYTMLDDRLRR